MTDRVRHDRFCGYNDLTRHYVCDCELLERVRKDEQRILIDSVCDVYEEYLHVFHQRPPVQAVVRRLGEVSGYAD